MKFETRSPNFETIPKPEIQMLETDCIDPPFKNFEIWLFEFVSDFDIRVSNLYP